jgi:hypothetical protein
MGERSKAGNAARLEAMAAESHEREQRERSEGWDAAELAYIDARNGATDALAHARLRDDLDACQLERAEWRLECERLRVIVDAACAEVVAERAYFARGNPVQEPGTARWVAWQEARDASRSAVQAEVERRG